MLISDSGGHGLALREWIWKETAEVLGVLGVIASLVFVAMEIRQNTDAVRSTAIQGMLDQSFAANLTPVENAGLREAIYSTPEKLTDDQRRQLGWFYAALIRLQLNRYSQAGIGVVDEGYCSRAWCERRRLPDCNLPKLVEAAGRPILRRF